VKFLVDMPLSPVLSHWLTEMGHDAVHASVIGLHAASDVEIIYRARQEARTVITADLDYPRLIAAARSDSPSLILSEAATGQRQVSVPDWQRSCPF
jgi:predicted nuclease of predicted toxin-antitoxin system